MEESELGHAQWTNVQDPVKQMLSAITKAVRTQSAGIKDLDRRVDSLPTKSYVDTQIGDGLDAAMRDSKAEIAPLTAMLSKKANISDLSTLELNTIAMAKQLDKINELLHSQNNAILSMNNRISQLSSELDEVKNPNYEKVFQYIDRQTSNIMDEVDRKLASRADMKEAEIMASTRRINEEVVPSILGQLAELKVEMRDVATRADINMIANTKAAISDLNDLTMDLGERPTRSELHQAVNSQIRPLVTAITAMEKAIHVQEININSSRLQWQQQSRQLAETQRAPSPTRSLSREQVGDIVEEVLREKNAQNSFVSPAMMEGSISDSRQAILNEVAARREELKQDIMTAQKEFLASFKRQSDVRLQEISTSAREAKEMNGKAKVAIKELASNVAKALAKKVDRADLKRAMKENVEELNVKPVTSVSSGHKKGDDGRHSAAEPQHLLSSSLDNWLGNASTGRMSGSLLDGAGTDSALRANSENKRNEDLLRGQLELVQEHLITLKAQMDGLQHTVTRQQSKPKESRGIGADAWRPDSDPEAGSRHDQEWRAAVADMAKALRRELSDKAGREELHNTVRSELDLLETRFHTIKHELNRKASVDDLGRVEGEVALLRDQVTGELTGARWLWTSGKLLKEGYIPWDAEVSNALPTSLLWRPSSPIVQTRTPGLYRVCVAIFTSLPCMLQVCLNGEPIMTLQPDGGSAEWGGSASLLEEKYVLRKNRHSAGEVTCLSVDEHVSLPSNAKLSVRFNSQASAQGFFSIKKL